VKLAAPEMTPELEAYLNSQQPASSGVLARMEAELEDNNLPGIGPAVGRFLALLLRMNRCVDVLELGTATGYSALWLAGGCTGRVTSLESDPERVRLARANIAEAALSGRIEVIEVDALAYLESEGGEFDAVFNDLLNSFPDEQTAERSFRLSLERLRPGGMLLADNALRRGEVVNPQSRGALNVVRYNQLVADDPSLESLIVPLRDGVSIARKADAALPAG